MENTLVSNHIKTWRARKGARGINRAALARRMGVSRSYITKIEQGKNLPTLALALRLSRYFGCTVNDLFEVRVGSMTEKLF